MLRSLLAAEFALEPDINEAMLNDEWTEASMLLSKEDCLCIRDNQITLGRNVKFYSILRNILLPFTDGLLIVCTTLLNVSIQSLFALQLDVPLQFSATHLLV